MEPLHPDTPQQSPKSDRLENALIPVILAAIFLLLTLELGWWDKIIAVVAKAKLLGTAFWDIYGIMGLWGG